MRQSPTAVSGTQSKCNGTFPGTTNKHVLLINLANTDCVNINCGVYWRKGYSVKPCSQLCRTPCALSVHKGCFTKKENMWWFHAKTTNIVRKLTKMESSGLNPTTWVSKCAPKSRPRGISISGLYQKNGHNMAWIKPVSLGLQCLSYWATMVVKDTS